MAPVGACAPINFGKLSAYYRSTYCGDEIGNSKARKTAMETTGKLIMDMGIRCRDMIQAANTFDSKLPTALQPSHLLWMCDQLEHHAAEWPATKLHRWIGFIQGAMLAHRMVDLAGAKSMFDDAKLAHSGLGQDKDLVDHLDPENSFVLEIGGQG